ncbi:MAG TPA: 50S ribosomal protein L29 [Ignavibacteria bacterium]|nr:50S ribosomal protein L29 [Ignavibacteria bacterium]
MKIYQIRELSTEDLRNAIQDNYDALENFRFQKATSQLENYKSLMNTKRDIARMLTILKERELGLNKDLATKEPKPKPKKEKTKTEEVKASSSSSDEEKPKKTRKPAAKKSEKTETKAKTKKAKSEN